MTDDSLGAFRRLLLMGFLPSALGGDDDGPEMLLYVRGKLAYVDIVKVFGKARTEASRLSNGREERNIAGDLDFVVGQVAEWPTTAIAFAGDVE